MPEGPVAIDTNLIIRYLTNDTPKQARAVENLLKQAIKEELELPDVIIAEIVWVLLSFYELPKNEVLEKLEGILALEKIKINKKVIRKTIEIWRNHSISYIDAYLAAYSIYNNNRKFYSFDKKLDNISPTKRVSPTE